MPYWPLRVIKMSLNKRKKTLCSGFLLIGLVYTIVQLTYYQQAYSPLQVLANAESEAKRLLKFMTLYHYQCNSTVSSGNTTSWRICTEPDAGINIESPLPKIAYSVGPSSDYSFELLLAKNFTFQQFIFSHEAIPTVLTNLSGTHVYKKIIVPNDPADFGRNSYGTQTLNDIIVNFGHYRIDLMKLESYLDMTDSHETIFYLVKDNVLSKVQQLHIVLQIDKISEDYLYNWYRSLYVLFHEAGFRLYHTAASDLLCLQVTMMESCRYYMSWIKNPGPTTFILHPPAIDGSAEQEEKRILDFLESKESSCHDNVEFQVTSTNTLSLCADIVEKKSKLKCNILIFSEKVSAVPKSESSFSSCSVTHILPVSQHNTLQFRVISYRPRDKTSGQSEHTLPLADILSQLLSPKNINILYISLPHHFWDLITALLDSAALELVDQLTADVAVFDSMTELIPSDIRRKYSELRRIEAFKFQVYEVSKFATKTIHFHEHKTLFGNCCYRISYVKSTF